ncbi:chromophore lyase CpcT/CpeT [Synechococcus sp. PCC 7336]|uniref:chromophore lyase CpcT/CpeT n=1 Tax=Synechococcus sp. PCC 7336 TaxID=195250 RepID=UPI0003466975|nr:chromophore lyase CpcT/CpeT [Synechococcus sp. PCC 7336]
MSDRPSPQLLELTRCLAGHFNNIAQAMEQPVYFANIHVHHCPLPWSVFDGPGLYLEQHYDVYPDYPYRQGAYRVYETDEGLWLQNYALANRDRFIGACRDLSKVAEMTAADFVQLPGCLSNLVPTETGFHGESIPSKNCRVTRKDRETYLVVKFDITPTRFTSLDRGLDVETDEQVWGSQLGSFEFVKVKDYAERVPRGKVAESF